MFGAEEVLNLTKLISDSASDNNDAGGAITVKVTTMVVLFCASTFFGLLPYKFQDSNRILLIIPNLLSFGGGVLLATIFLHLLPQVTKKVNWLQQSGKLPHFEFHFAELLMCIGFFTKYFVEECVQKYLHYREHIDATRSSENAFRRGISVSDSAVMKTPKIPLAEGSISDGMGQTNNAPNVSSILLPLDASTSGSTSQQQNHHHHDTDLVQSHQPNSNDDNLIVSPLCGLLVVLALSVHDLFEGLAVGLEETVSTVWYMFGAVAAHKFVLAFCVGVELVVNKTKFWLTIVYVVTFAICGPLGIGIGILLSNMGNSESFHVPAVILQCFATGTLLYVVFFEILSKTERPNLKQYAVGLFGFLLMFGLQFLTGHQHSHGGSTGDDHDHDHDDRT